MTVPDLASELTDESLLAKGSPVSTPGLGFVRGWAVFGLPFDSGHVLAMRVFPESDAGPYRSLWHRDPAGEWKLYVHADHLDTACPRYYGAAARSVELATIEVDWTGPASFRVRLDGPSIDWTVTASDTLALRWVNAISRRLPMWTFRPAALVRARELLARGLGMGDLQLTGVTPSGHQEALMPQRMFYIEESEATIDGVDLGRPTHVRPNPRIGTMALPARGVLATGQGRWQA